MDSFHSEKMKHFNDDISEGSRRGRGCDSRNEDVFSSQVGFHERLYDSRNDYQLHQETRSHKYISERELSAESSRRFHETLRLPTNSNFKSQSSTSRRWSPLTKKHGNEFFGNGRKKMTSYYSFKAPRPSPRFTKDTSLETHGKDDEVLIDEKKKEKDETERIRRTRTSALQRLGPKVRQVSERLGVKVRQEENSGSKKSSTAGYSEESSSSSSSHFLGTFTGNENGKKVLRSPTTCLTCPICFFAHENDVEYESHLYSSKHLEEVSKYNYDAYNRKSGAVGSLWRQESTSSSSKVLGAIEESRNISQKQDTNGAQFTCEPCSLDLTSSNEYIKHVCSLSHLKKEKYNLSKEQIMVGTQETVTIETEEEESLDYNDLMTIDEIGQVDDNILSPVIENDKKELQNSKGDTKLDFESSVGGGSGTGVGEGDQFIKSVEMLFCELCHKFLPRCEPHKQFETKSLHCQTTPHMNAYHKKCKNPSEPFNEDQLDYEPP